MPSLRKTQHQLFEDGIDHLVVVREGRVQFLGTGEFGGMSMAGEPVEAASDPVGLAKKLGEENCVGR
jgi:hypothetical protein